MGKDEEALTGFSWRSGSDRETTGILMWSRPFIATIPETGEEVREKMKHLHVQCPWRDNLCLQAF